MPGKSRRPSGPRSRTKPHLYLDGPEVYKIFDRAKARRTARLPATTFEFGISMGSSISPDVVIRPRMGLFDV